MTLYPEDTPDHQMIVYERVGASASADPDFDNLEQVFYHYTDQVAGSGTHKGYLIMKNRQGDKIFSQYEGIHRVVIGAAGWEGSAEGRLQYTGGTGKFKTIKGSGPYRMKIIPAGGLYHVETTWEGEVES